MEFSNVRSEHIRVKCRIVGHLLTIRIGNLAESDKIFLTVIIFLHISDTRTLGWSQTLFRDFEKIFEFSKPFSIILLRDKK